MWIAIVVLVVIVFLFIVGSNAPKFSEQYAMLLNEVVELLRIAQEFTNSPYWENESGLVMLIPVTKSGELYRSHGANYEPADRIRVSISIYADLSYDDYVLKLYPPSDDMQRRYKLVKEDGRFSFQTETFSTFNCGYKAIMPIINERVKAEFPNVTFEFDGSRVMTNKMHK